MTFPSEIVDFIDARFSQVIQTGDNRSLNTSYTASLLYLVRLLDKLPQGIVTLKGKSLADFGESVEFIRTSRRKLAKQNCTNTPKSFMYLR